MLPSPRPDQTTFSGSQNNSTNRSATRLVARERDRAGAQRTRRAAACRRSRAAAAAASSSRKPGIRRHPRLDPPHRHRAAASSATKLLAGHGGSRRSRRTSRAASWSIIVRSESMKLTGDSGSCGLCSRRARRPAAELLDRRLGEIAPFGQLVDLASPRAAAACAGSAHRPARARRAARSAPWPRFRAGWRASQKNVFHRA